MAVGLPMESPSDQLIRSPEASIAKKQRLNKPNSGSANTGHMQGPKDLGASKAWRAAAKAAIGPQYQAWKNMSAAERAKTANPMTAYIAANPITKKT